jgi:hypothetical protein
MVHMVVALVVVVVMVGMLVITRCVHFKWVTDGTYGGRVGGSFGGFGGDGWHVGNNSLLHQ